MCKWHSGGMHLKSMSRQISTCLMCLGLNLITIVSSKFETQKENKKIRRLSRSEIPVFLVQKWDNHQALNGIKHWVTHITL